MKPIEAVVSLNSSSYKNIANINLPTKSTNHTYDFDVIPCSNRQLNILSNQIKPFRMIWLKNNAKLLSEIQEFSLDKWINVLDTMHLTQMVQSSTQKNIGAQFNLSIDSSVSPDGVEFLSFDDITNENTGFILPSSTYNKNTYCLRGDIDKCEDLSIFDNKTLYVNLDNIENLMMQLKPNESVSIGFYYTEASVFSMSISNEYIYIDISDSESYKVFENNINSDVEASGWIYSEDGDIQESLPQSVVDNHMNIQINIDNIYENDFYAEATDADANVTELNKTVISSYPFDCSNMTECIDLYTVFINTGSGWTFAPNKHIDSIA